MKTAKPTKKTTTSTKSPSVETPTLGKIVLIHTKSSSYGFGLLDPKIVTIEEMKFLEGIQVTGRETHRMEKKRTMIPFDHVASIVEFLSEEDLWKHSQPKQPQNADETAEDSTPRAPEQPHRRHNNRKHNQNHHRRHQEAPRDNFDGRLQAQYDASGYRKFNR